MLQPNSYNLGKHLIQNVGIYLFGGYAKKAIFDFANRIESRWYPSRPPRALYPAIIGKDTYDATHKRLEALRPGIQAEDVIERRLQAG